MSAPPAVEPEESLQPKKEEIRKVVKHHYDRLTEVVLYSDKSLVGLMFRKD